MNHRPRLLSTNVILYCRSWRETVEFYRDRLQLPVTLSKDWFVEFRLTPSAHVSVADERRARIKSSAGQGMTLTWQVEDIEAAWQALHARGVAPDPIRDHPWGGRAFHFHDPEGHRLEIWSQG